MSRGSEMDLVSRVMDDPRAAANETPGHLRSFARLLMNADDDDGAAGVERANWLRFTRRRRRRLITVVSLCRRLSVCCVPSKISSLPRSRDGASPLCARELTR